MWIGLLEDERILSYRKKRVREVVDLYRGAGAQTRYNAELLT
jgi:hypothetical protein